MELLQQSLNGLMLGSMYALVAMGLTLVYAAGRIVNLAHHEIFMFASFAAIYLSLDGGLGSVWAIVGAIAISAGIAYVLYLAALRYVDRQNMLATFVSTLAFGLLLQNIIIERYGSSNQAFDLLSGAAVIPGPLTISYSDVVLLIIALAAGIGLAIVMFRSPLGRRWRAVASNPYGAKLLGISTEKTLVLALIVATVLAAFAGLIAAARFGSTSAFVGELIALKALAVVVIGGLGDVRGALIGGIAIGLAETFLRAYGPAEYASGLIWAVLLVTLCVRPAGIFQRTAVTREV